MRLMSRLKIGFRGLRVFLMTSCLLLAPVAPPAAAQEFKLAMSSPPTSMDPHFYNLFPNKWMRCSP